MHIIFLFFPILDFLKKLFAFSGVCITFGSDTCYLVDNKWCLKCNNKKFKVKWLIKIIWIWMIILINIITPYLKVATHHPAKVFIYLNPTNIWYYYIYICSFSIGLKEMQTTSFHCTALTHAIIRERITTIFPRQGLSACTSCWTVSGTSEIHCSIRAGRSTISLMHVPYINVLIFPECAGFLCGSLSFLGI